MEEILNKRGSRIKKIKADENSDSENSEKVNIKDIEDDKDKEVKEIAKNNVISKARESRKWTKIAKDLKDGRLINEVIDEGIKSFQIKNQFIRYI